MAHDKASALELLSLGLFRQIQCLVAGSPVGAVVLGCTGEIRRRLPIFRTEAFSSGTPSRWWSPRTDD